MPVDVVQVSPILHSEESLSVRHKPLEPMNRRTTATTPDRRTVLVVRILTQPESENDNTSSRIQGVFFNAFNSVASQMRLCSNNRILLEEPPDMEPVQTAVVNWVDDPANRTKWVQAAQEQFSETMADHVLFVLPDSYRAYTTKKFVAEAKVNGTIAVFGNNQYLYSMSSYMHEIGRESQIKSPSPSHQFFYSLYLDHLGLRHAGYGTDLYGDTSGYMGHSSTVNERKCYNAAQHWQLGWYPRHRRSLLDETTPQRVRLHAFVDVRNTDGPVLLQIDEHHYAQFNRAKAYNTHTFLDDTVVVVEDRINRTQVVDALSAHDTIQVGSTSIEVCDVVIYDDQTLVDYAELAINEACQKIHSDSTPTNPVTFIHIDFGDAWKDLPASRPNTYGAAGDNDMDSTPTPTFSPVTPAPIEPVTFDFRHVRPKALGPTVSPSDVPSLFGETEIPKQVDNGQRNLNAVISGSIGAAILLLLLFAAVVYWRRRVRRSDEIMIIKPFDTFLWQGGSFWEPMEEYSTDEETKCEPNSRRRRRRKYRDTQPDDGVI